MFIFLKVSSLKENEVETIKERIGAPRISLVPKSIITCWVHIAKTMKAVFSNEFTTEGYEILQKCLQEELILLPKV
jgi:hypothetical protein